MKTIEVKDADDILRIFVEQLEKTNESPIFTVRVLDTDNEDVLEAVIVFEDKSVMLAHVTNAPTEIGKMGLRVRARYI